MGQEKTVILLYYTSVIIEFNCSSIFVIQTRWSTFYTLVNYDFIKQRSIFLRHTHHEIGPLHLTTKYEL